MLERHVAVHVIAADDSRAAILLEAARRSTTVLDPRILRVLDAEVTDEVCYVVNEWGHGASLDTVVAAGGVLGPRRAAWLVSQVAESVAAAHAADVAHGRLNPENVLIDHGGGVRLIGFCVDAALHGLDHNDPSDDVTDLVGLLYCALTGRWAGVSGSGVEPAPSDHGQVLRPRRVRAGVPRSLDRLCDEVLHPHLAPRGRERADVTTARGLADYLAGYVGDPTGMPAALLAGVPAVLPDEELIVLPPVPEITVRYDDDTSVIPRTPAPGPERRPEPQPEPQPEPHDPAPADLPTEAGMPIFGDDDDVSWLERRSEPTPPPPPFEEPPERPLFAPDPPQGRPARSPRPAAQGPGPASDPYWPWAGGGGTHGPAPAPAGARADDAPRRPRRRGGREAAVPAGAPVAETRGRTGLQTLPPPAPEPEDDTVPGRTTLRLAVGLALVAILLVAVVVAINLGRGRTVLGGVPDASPSTSAPARPTSTPRPTTVLTGLSATFLDPQGTNDDENADEAPLAVDGDDTTAWRTEGYDQQLGPAGLKTGVGLVVDLAGPHTVGSVDLTFLGAPTSATVYAADEAPSDVTGLDEVGSGTADGTTLEVVPQRPVEASYLVVWLTELPLDGSRFRGQVAEVVVRGE